MSTAEIAEVEDAMEEKKRHDEETPEVEEEKFFLTLEIDGEEVECEIIEDFEMNGKNYMFLLAENDDDEAVVYSYTETEDGELELFNLEEDEFNEVVDKFIKLRSEDE